MKARNSAEHPLQFGRVNLGLGKLLLTICPGKVGPSKSGAPWKRDLRADLQQMKDMRVDHLITLMEWDEMRRYGVHHMGLVAKDMGIEWTHFPIVDGSVPQSEVRGAWRPISAALSRQIIGGSTIAIHCLGGLGRTGVVAAMILQDKGMSYLEAMDTVRAARPGAIENEAQEYFLSGYRAWMENRARSEAD